MNTSRHDFDRPVDPKGACGEPIAIVGAACRLPGAPDLEAFRRLLLSGTDAVTEIPDDRWNKALLFHPERGQRGKAYTFAAGIIDDVRGFDAAFFGISPREAVQMDPQQRLALELAYESLEDARIDVGTLAGERVGVFVGGSSWDYLNLHVADPAATDAYSMTGVTLCSLSNRVSYAFDLRGPSFTVDTACSSSLVALHQACEAIRIGQVPMALVGGISLLLAPQSYVGFCAASMLSPRGRCHAFGAEADGYVRAEGGGFVVLKPLSKALAAGDPVRAVIRGTGINSDGRTTGFSLPNKQAQIALLEEVYERFGLDPDQLAYLEAHGTGTPAGDPIELGALGHVLGQPRRTGALPIGSVKTNVGHLEAGSGMAGLMKALIVADAGVVPPSLHASPPNPHVPFETLNLAVVQAPLALTDGGAHGLIGINSFGFGGTNAHAVLEIPPRADAPADEAPGDMPPLLLSAQSEPALRVLAASWAERLTADTSVASVAPLVRAGAHRRQQLHHRAVIVPGPAVEIAAAADALARGTRDARVVTDTAVAGKVAFVFSGNGSQWAGMASDALQHSAAFRAALTQVDAALAPHLGWSATEALAAPDATRLRDTEVAQPLLFAIQVALVLALREQGVVPDRYMGHSVGEVAAAWAAGALDLDTAARVICARSRAQQARHGIGGMGVLGLGAEQTAAVLQLAPLTHLGLNVAAHNGAQATTVAGPENGLAVLAEEAQRQGWRFTRLDLDYAFHNAILDPIRDGLLADLATMASRPTHRGFVSTVTGAAMPTGPLDADYWWRNVRAPVLFVEAAAALVADGVRIFVEVGPNSALRAYLAEALRDADVEGRVLPTLARRPLVHDPIAVIAARIHAAGGDIRDGASFTGPETAAALPSYPWQREPFWLPRTQEAADPFTLPFEHVLLGYRLGDEPVEWRQHIALELQPWLADHVVGGTAVMPAAALIDMALAAARARFPGAASIELLDVEIGRALVLEPGIAREVVLRVDAADARFEIRSRPRFSTDAWTAHMKGRLVAPNQPAPTLTAAPAKITGRLGAEALYALADRMGLTYGPAFRAVRAVEITGEGSAVARLAPTGLVGTGFLLSPDLVDGGLQGLVGLAAERLGMGSGVMPWRFGRVRLLTVDQVTPVAAHLHLTRIGPRSVRADVALTDADGKIVAELLECWFVRVTLAGGARPETYGFHPRWIAAAAPGAVLDIEDEPAALIGQTPAAPSPLALLADAYASAIVVETLAPMAAHGHVDPAALLAQGAIAPASATLLDQWLAWAEADGFAARADDGTWQMTLEDVPPSAAILQTLLLDAPRGVAEAALLAQAAEGLPRLLHDGPAASPALPDALWQQLLFDSPTGEAAAQALEAALAQVAAQLPIGRPLRILEIGAGRGRFTARLLRTLADLPHSLVAATDVDSLPVLTNRLATIAGTRAVAMGAGDALGNGPFDVVVGLYPLAAGGWTGPTLAALRASLAQGGLLIMAEPAPNRLWQLLRPADGSLGSAFRWRAMLEAAGFVDIASRDLGVGLWPATLLSARARRTSEQKIGGRWTMVGEAGDPALAQLPAAEDRFTDIAAWLAHDAPSPAVLVMDARDLPARLSEVACLAALPIETSHEIALIVRGTADGDPAAAALTGARRVLANEAPHVRVRLIRIDPALDNMEAAGQLAAELASDGGEEEVALTPAGRRVARIWPGPPRAVTAVPDLRLTIERPGLLDSLAWAEVPPATPGSGEVAILVKAAGLNFRDVMWAMQLLPDEALLDGFAGATLGLECAGVVAAVGTDVTEFAPGERVMAFAPASLGTYTITAAHAVMRMPPAIDFAAAATVPVAFLTVAYAIGHLAQIEPGETILIHGGAGGVGLAAIQYARHKGARVIATAGSTAKRALLRQIGVEAVLDSRSLSFADEVMRLTAGQGVDVVLNSLAGEAMQRSLGVLKPFGRFLELGKRDFYENSAIGLRPFRHNVTYFGIDADQLPLKRPRLAEQIFAELSRLFAAGTLQPLPHRLFDFAEVEEAFRLMQASGHVGKVVLAPGPVLPRALPAPAALTLDGDGVYLVTGGLDGFGLAAARWLAKRGARHLALLGRRGPATQGATDTLAAFAAAGVDARAYAVDVSDQGALDDVLTRIRAEQGPLRGVIHAAVAMDDALMNQLDTERFARALAPKLGGALALDRLTRGDTLDLFLLFSSVTTSMGNPGQGNYVAANAAVEAVAEARHAAGLPALAIQWGPIGDAGYLSREQGISDLLSRQLGNAHFLAEEALDAIPALLASGAPVAGWAAVRWPTLHGRLPLLATPLFADLAAGDAGETAEIDLRELLASSTPEEARKKATAVLAEEVAHIMKLAPERVEAERPLAELGMDSLMAVELRLAVEARFGVSIPILALSEGTTLASMAGRILRSLGETDAEPAADDATALVQRLRRHEGDAIGGPADHADAPSEPGYAAAAATAP